MQGIFHWQNMRGCFHPKGASKLSLGTVSSAEKVATGTLYLERMGTLYLWLT